MDSFLQLSDEDKITFCEQGQARRGFPAASLEKDFWVCWTLRQLFQLPKIGDSLCFKGGTSLSKAWKLISRFSEDIDIVIDRGIFGFEHDVPSTGQLNKLREKSGRYVRQEILPALTQILQENLPPDAKWVLRIATKDEDPDEQSLIFEYPGVLLNRMGYLRPMVKLEFGARGDTDPVENPIIQSYLCEIFPDQLADEGFPVRTVSPVRTFWEKAMLLHEDAQRGGDSPRKRFLARHYYDLWAMGETDVAERAMADLDLFERILAHRKAFFHYNWMNYDSMCPGRFQFRPPADQERGWRADYEAMKDEMFAGETPSFDTILLRLEAYEHRFNT